MVNLSIKEKKLLKKIVQKYLLELLLLFGSRVSGKVLRGESDYDIAYLSKKNLNLMDEAKLICDLMPVFKSDKVDLANLRKAGPLLMKQIFDNHIILFCRNPQLYYQYKIYAERKYAEATPLFKLQEELIDKFLKKHA